MVTIFRQDSFTRYDPEERIRVRPKWLDSLQNQQRGGPCRPGSCPYCKHMLRMLGCKEDGRHWLDDGVGTNVMRALYVCQQCGWWAVADYPDEFQFGAHNIWSYGDTPSARIGTLARLSLSAGAPALEEVRRYLAAQWHRRFDAHPRYFEEIVGDVFRGQGFFVRVTAYSNDGGIDLILLDRGNNEPVGVQIKRTRQAVGVSYLREFVGALYLHGLRTGIFVTASTYTSGARAIPGQASTMSHPVAIDLWDSSRLYAAIGAGLRPAYSCCEEADAPWRDAWLAPFDLPNCPAAPHISVGVSWLVPGFVQGRHSVRDYRDAFTGNYQPGWWESTADY